MAESIVHGVKLKSERDMVVRALEQRGSFEPDSMAVWLGALKPGFVAIDIGAYTGVYAIAAAMRGVEVIAYEPNVHVFIRLMENIVLNDVDVVAHNLAAADYAGECFLATKNGDMTSAGSLKGEMNGHGQKVRVDTVKCEKPVSVMKIDVEGAELSVLKGAAGIIQRDKPIIIAEALTTEARETLIDHLSAYGYSYRHADQANLIFIP